MNNHSTPSTATPDRSNSPKTNNSDTKLKPFTLTTPKLFLPTLACLLTTALFGLLISILNFAPSLLPDPFYIPLHFLLMLLAPALGFFLLYRLLEVIILHHAFRPAHLICIIVILLSASSTSLTSATYYNAIYRCIIPYIGIIFTIFLFFQKSHSITTNSAQFRRSLLFIAATSLFFGLINTLIITIAAFGFINQATENILFFAAIFLTLPLQIALTFICLSRYDFIKSTNLLSHSDRFLLSAAFAFTIISTTAYLAFTEYNIVEDYSHRQPCCHQPVNYN